MMKHNLDGKAKEIVICMVATYLGVKSGQLLANHIDSKIKKWKGKKAEMDKVYSNENKTFSDFGWKDMEEEHKND